MTTNVICRPFKLLASDSRWSTPMPGHPGFVAFVDECGFDKIALRPTHALVFAGDGELIAGWKDWFSKPAMDFSNLPLTSRIIPGTNLDESIVVSLVRRATADVSFTVGRFVSHGEDARFTGSGAEFAKDCYAVNKCGKTSIGSAKTRDVFTGGDVKFVELESGSNNLNMIQATFQELLSAINQRGFVMDTKTNTVTPINEWRSSHPDADRAASAGSLTSISAPTGMPVRSWSDQEQGEFIKALQAVAAEEEEWKRAHA